MSLYHEFEMEVEIIPGEFTYVPSYVESSEAAVMFGELEDEADIEEFEAWIDGLQTTRYFEVRRAVETLRQALADYQGDLDMTRLLRAIRPS
jgi:hypothetical protein